MCTHKKAILILEIPGCLSRFGSAVLKKRSSASTSFVSRYVARDDLYSVNRWPPTISVLTQYRSSLATYRYLLTKQAPGSTRAASFLQNSTSEPTKASGDFYDQNGDFLVRTLRCPISPERHRQGQNKCN